MLLTQNTFYRKYGVWMLPQVMTPAMFDLKLLEFPRESVYHYLPFDGLTDGPANDDPLLRNVSRSIPVHTPLELATLEGQPRRMGGAGPALVREYLKDHRRMHFARDLNQAQKDKDVPLIINYALLVKIYRYQASKFAAYNRWKNLFTTMLDEVTHLTSMSNRQHYVFVHAPKTLPSVAQLVIASKEMDQQAIKNLRDTDSFLLLELWKWFYPSEEATTPSLFTRLPKEKIHLLNFVFVEGGKWCVANFGILSSFFLPEGQKEADPAYVVTSKQHVTGLQMAKRILRMYMTVMDVRNASFIAKIPQDAEIADDVQTRDSDMEVTPPVINAGAQDAPSPIGTQQTPAEVTLATQMNVYLPSISVIDEEEFSNLSTQDFQRLISEQDAEIHQDLVQLDSLSKQMANEEPHVTVEKIIASIELPTPEQGIVNLCDTLAVNGSISAAEYRKLTKIATNYKNIKAPVGEGTLEEFLVIPPQALLLDDSATMPDSDTVLDKTMLKSNLNLFDSKYVTNVLHKDIANAVMSIQNTGIAVTAYKVDTVSDILGGYEEHVVKLMPVIGQPSTLRFKVPVIHEDGTYVTNGVKYRLRKQRGEVPIRKTAPGVVALTSYYGKCFITRGKRNSANYGYWLQTTALAMALDIENKKLTDPVCDTAFDSELKAPRSYSAIANTLRQVTVDGKWSLNFDHREIAKTYPPQVLSRYEKKGSLVVGNAGSSYLVLDAAGNLFEAADGNLNPLGTLESFMGIDTSDAPIEYTTARIFGKDIPVGIILGLEMGLERLVAALKVKPRIVPAGERVNLQSHEYALQFSDESWVFSRHDKLASLILGGFNSYSKAIKLFSVHSFDKRGVYVNLLETSGLGVRFIREIDLMNNMFVDSITRDILIEMKEPTTFKGLLLRSCQMLLTDDHPDAMDPAFMRIKGYERISGAIYTEMIMSIRQHNGTLGKSNAGLLMNPYSVWKRISEDPAKLQVSEINPLSTLKDMEAVTYIGEGGRGSRSMTKDTRGYHVNDMGTISESTVDSTDVSINIHTSADPQFTSLRGMSKRFDMAKPNPTALLSTSALLAPASDRDDPKRVNFVSIQQKHAVACDGYHQHTVRTGYDSVLAYRTDELYAFTAKKPGKVRAIVDKGIIVDYDDGTYSGYELGRRFGNSQGLTVAHNVVTPLKEGDEFKVGDAIVYNTGFFEPDFFDAKRIVWKNSINARTVLWESCQTLEDSSAVSARIAQKLSTKITKVKTIVLSFDQAITDLVKVGAEVVSDSVLCIIQEAVTANNKLFNTQSIETLKALSAQTPRAHVKGKVEKIEVFYHGDKEDMSESVRELCDVGDASLRKLGNAVGIKPYVGQVDGGFRIENNPLSLDTVAVRVYITSNVAAGYGDKGVFANQLKTCFGEVMEKPMTTEDGVEVDAVFGYRSLEARIVESPIIIGTTAALLRVVGQNAAAIYRGTAK